MIDDSVVNDLTLILTTALTVAGGIYGVRMTRKFNNIESRQHEIRDVVRTPDDLPPIGVAVAKILENGGSGEDHEA